MRIDWSTLGLQAVNLLVLLWILGRFLFRPLARIVAERQAQAGRMLDDAAARSRQAEQALAVAQGQQQSAQAERAVLLDQARAEAESQRAVLLTQAREQAAQVHAQAQAAIARLRENEDQRVGNRAAQLATDVAARLLERVPQGIPLAGFMQGFEQAVASLSPAAREQIGADGQFVALLTARQTSSAEQAACAELMQRALGRKIELTFRVDTSLIAGLRLETAQARVDNSLQADVEKIARELAAHE
ncbi:MAG: F0F1 ATP synthase subunit delta [Burkholderiaceae bacterium]|jgi:F-type H+-transporting ATPase subunit b|nr:F0F1 ATP synthase subunit delta [Burkholderiaceae bacterium]